MKIRAEHGGAKNSSAKGGFWGYRKEAKALSRVARRADARKAERDGKK